MSEIRVNTFKAEDGISAPSIPNGIQVTGVVTATVLDSTVPFLNAGSNIQLGNAGVVTATNYVGTINTPAQPNITSVGTLSSLNVSGNVSIAGTLTYEDVTNVDSVGVVTARSGVITPNVDVDDFISVGSNIHLGNAGIITASSFVDDGTNLLTEINTKATTGKAIAMAMIFG